jgi:hypothetical protein
MILTNLHKKDCCRTQCSKYYFEKSYSGSRNLARTMSCLGSYSRSGLWSKVRSYSRSRSGLNAK